MQLKGKLGAHNTVQGTGGREQTWLRRQQTGGDGELVHMCVCLCVCVCVCVCARGRMLAQSGGNVTTPGVQESMGISFPLDITAPRDPVPAPRSMSCFV